MSYHNIDPCWPTPFIAEADYGKGQTFRRASKPDPVTMFRSYEASIRQETDKE